MNASAQPFTLATLQTGALATYPNLTLCDFFTAQEHYFLKGIEITSTMTNLSVAPMGVFVVVGQQEPIISLSPASRIVAQLAVTTANFVTKQDHLAFGRYGIEIPSGSPVSLYCCGTIPAFQALYGIALLFMAQK